MEGGIGAGLGALGFWLFIALIVIGGMWYSIREKDAQQETMRRIIESGQPVDQALIDRIFGSKRLDRDLKIAGLITIFTAPGLAVLGWFISLLSEPWLLPMLGVAVLVAFVGGGLLVAAKFAERSLNDDDTPTPV
jgi:uncharacterized protein YneF (UPF0154 family)